MQRSDAEIAWLSMDPTNDHHVAMTMAVRQVFNFCLAQVGRDPTAWTREDVITFNRMQMLAHGLDVLPDAAPQQSAAPVNQGLKQAVDDGRKANNPGSSADSPGTTGGADQGQKKPATP